MQPDHLEDSGLNRFLAAAIGGLVATVPMTLLMTRGHRFLPEDEQYPLPPREITDEISRRAGLQLTEEAGQGLSLAAHFAYGGLTGAMYPLLTGKAPGERYGLVGEALWGGGYGLAVWAGSYLGWIPALDILAPPNRQPTRRRRLMLAAHLVWGATTVLVGEQLAQRPHESPSASAPPPETV